MKKILFSLAALALLATSCADKNAYTITGKVVDNRYDSTLIYLKTASLDDPQGGEVVDSVLVVNGAFAFKGIAGAEPEFRVFQFAQKEGERRARTAFVVQEPGTIEAFVDSVDTSLKGTAKNVEFQTYKDTGKNLQKEMKALYDKGREMPNDTTLEKQFYELKDKHVQNTYDFIKANAKTKIGAYLFIANSRAFETDRVKELLAEITPELKSAKGIKEVEDRILAIENTAEGKPYTNISGKNHKGETIALADYVGKSKLVLVDFWASWCGPCIKDMPEVVALYNKYKSKGFEIVGVSLDDDGTKWTEALAKHKMTWPQMSDLKGWASDLSKPYVVSSIPHTMLISQDGTIVARGLRGEDLAKKIDELLK